MEKSKLEVYTFVIHSNRKANEKILMEDVYGNDLYNLLKNNFQNYVNEFPPDKVNKKTTKIEKVFVSENKYKSVFTYNDTLRIVSGKIKVGDDDGKEQDVVSNNKDKIILYTKKKGQSVERPYFFMFILPLNLKYGFLILEREGKHSVKGTFNVLFKNFIYDKFAGLKLKVFNFVEDEIVKEFLTDGNYESITLSKKIISNDKSEQYFGEFQDGSKYKIQLKITPLDGSYFPSITKRKVLKNIEEKNGFFEGQEFKNIGFDEDAKITVVSTHNGNTRTIDLEDTFKIRPYYNIEQTDDSKGFSDFNEIYQESIKLVKSFDLNVI